MEPLAVDDAIFSAESYKLDIPTLDGHRATQLDIRFSGSGSLDRTSEDDLALLEAMRIGAPVRLIVTGEISAKAFRLGTGNDAEFSYSCTVRVASVDAARLPKSCDDELNGRGLSPQPPNERGARSPAGRHHHEPDPAEWNRLCHLFSRRVAWGSTGIPLLVRHALHLLCSPRSRVHVVPAGQEVPT